MKPAAAESQPKPLPGRDDKRAWDIINEYVVTGTPIKELHEALSVTLGSSYDEEFWNSVITDVTPDDDNTLAALAKFIALRARHVPSQNGAFQWVRIDIPLTDSKYVNRRQSWRR